MNEEQVRNVPEEGKAEVDEVGTFRPRLSMPDKYIVIAANTKERKIQADEVTRLNSLMNVSEITTEVRNVLTGSRYAMEPMGTCELKVHFYQDGQPIKPEGTLLLQTKRGKLSPTRYELDGTKDEVIIKYTAPDETIRVSVRAFLEGFYRGKIRLYLEEEAHS